MYDFLYTLYTRAGFPMESFAFIPDWLVRDVEKRFNSAKSFWDKVKCITQLELSYKHRKWISNLPLGERKKFQEDINLYAELLINLKRKPNKRSLQKASELREQYKTYFLYMCDLDPSVLVKDKELETEDDEFDKFITVGTLKINLRKRDVVLNTIFSMGVTNAPLEALRYANYDYYLEQIENSIPQLATIECAHTVLTNFAELKGANSIRDEKWFFQYCILYMFPKTATSVTRPDNMQKQYIDWYDTKMDLCRQRGEFDFWWVDDPTEDVGSIFRLYLFLDDMKQLSKAIRNVDILNDDKLPVIITFQYALADMFNTDSHHIQLKPSNLPIHEILARLSVASLAIIPWYTMGAYTVATYLQSFVCMYNDIRWSKPVFRCKDKNVELKITESDGMIYRAFDHSIFICEGYVFDLLLGYTRVPLKEYIKRAFKDMDLQDIYCDSQLSIMPENGFKDFPFKRPPLKRRDICVNDKEIKYFGDIWYIDKMPELPKGPEMLQRMIDTLERSKYERLS